MAIDKKRKAVLARVIVLCHEDAGWRVPLGADMDKTIDLWDITLKAVPTEFMEELARTAIENRADDARIAGAHDIRKVWLDTRDDLLRAKAAERALEHEYLHRTVCSTCNGAGWLEKGHGMFVKTVRCHKCDGTYVEPMPLYKGTSDDISAREYGDRHRRDCKDPDCTHLAHRHETPWSAFGAMQRDYLARWRAERSTEKREKFVEPTTAYMERERAFMAEPGPPMDMAQDYSEYDFNAIFAPLRSLLPTPEQEQEPEPKPKPPKPAPRKRIDDYLF